MNEVALIEKFCERGGESYLSQLSEETLLFFYLVAKKATEVKVKGLNTIRANNVIEFYYSKKIDEKSLPNLKGKAFEFAICRAIIDVFDIPIASKSIPRYYQYSLKYDFLPKDIQYDFSVSADHITDWIQDTFVSGTFKEVLLLPDHYGGQGVVADIVIRTAKRTPSVAISAKNSMLYAKSPRPLSILDHGDLDSTIVHKWRKEYKEIIHSFYEKFHHFGKKFTNIPNAAYIKRVHLYDPINSKLQYYLSHWFLNPKNVQTFFTFLSGVDKNYVIVNTTKHILIYDHTVNHPPPKTMKISMNTFGYIIIHFSNGFIVSMRLHTASSRFQKEVSLKYDVRITNVDEIYPVTIIEK
jgi:hypothetical protein